MSPGRTGGLVTLKHPNKQIRTDVVRICLSWLPPIDIKYADRISYYNAFDEYHIKHDVSAMEKLFARYANSRLDMYLKILEK